jgi:hypothetical protein
MLLISFLSYSNLNFDVTHYAESQQNNLPKVPSIRITSPETDQLIPATTSSNQSSDIGTRTNATLVISGTASDDSKSPCDVSVLVNDVRPYQPATPEGTSGKNDYSNWEFYLTPEYAPIKQGPNKITAKLECLKLPVNLTKWYSVSVNGGTQEQVTQQEQQLQRQELEKEQQGKLALEKIQLEEQRKQQMIERAKVNAAKINQSALFVTIESPAENQSIPMDSNLTISGTSYDDAATDCDVSVVLNSKTPYQRATPINGSGTNNYSNWTFTFTPSYGVPKEGQNEMTSRISCLAYPNNYTKFSSINVTGVPQDSSSLQQQQNALQTQQQSGQQLTQRQPLFQQEEKQLSIVPYAAKSQNIRSGSFWQRE